MPKRFAILCHDYPFRHWDLLLEEAAGARSWRLFREPCCGEPIAGEALPPHRLLYLNFEGSVSGNRGRVNRVITGAYVVTEAASNELQVLFFDNPVLASGRLRTLDDGRQFWIFQGPAEGCSTE